MQTSFMARLSANTLSISYSYPDEPLPIQSKGQSDPDSSPSHRTLLKTELGGKMHAGGKTERIGV